ncbi:P27 family phage terminase small subunit [Paenibacillus sp. BK033]|uniref:P27 family phage terminase small subunit n=1 Tax=Paenibacillus sp. BK033 TaxID=2512133 RepID=UPI00104711C2|nr:P27 family phage terminase small subunit [Paenibacillus sp. BK033]
MAKAGEKALADQQIVFERTVRDMQSIGVYKAEYDPLIQMYAELVVQYNTLSERFRNGGMRYQTKTSDGGAKKAPLVATLEALRKDILAYSDRLCLNPKSFGSVTPDRKVGDLPAPKTSKLTAALSSFG